MRGANRLLTHGQSVRLLYRSILRLHRLLPTDMRALGDQYARDEFRRHKNVETEEAAVFLTGWAEYVQQLRRQLAAVVDTPHAPLSSPPPPPPSSSSSSRATAPSAVSLGSNLSPEQLQQLSDNQLVQLHQLLEAASSCVTSGGNTPASSSGSPATDNADNIGG